MKILIMGASGSGQSTLGRALANKLNYKWVDSDDIYWLPTTPMYQEKRNIDERLKIALKEAERESLVFSGSINGWGTKLENAFDIVVFLSLDTELRLSRLREREQRELGFVDEAFIEWASEYENPLSESRNRVKHEKWISERKSRILCLEGDETVQQRIEHVISFL